MSITNGKAKALAVLAEYENPAALMHAAEIVRDAGYTKFDCHSPYPIHGMDDAMGMKPSVLGFVVFIMAILGGTIGIGLQIWASTTAYPLVISGKPFNSFQAFVPVTFELTILLSAFGAVFGMFHLNKLPQLFHNLFYSEKFAKVTDDGFFVSIEAHDPKFEVDSVQKVLKEAGATDIEVVTAN